VPAGILVVVDAKRGDIGSTSARHAAALFDGLGADAVTVSPYLGEEAVAPLLERVDRFAYVLCRTSNPGAGELQDLLVAGDAAREAGGAPPEPLWARVAREASHWGPGDTVGLVVGATAPAELAAIRGIAPGLAMLVPGVGAQGGSIEAVLEDGPATARPAGGRPGGGLLVNVSRGIAGAALEPAPNGRADDLLERLAAAARTWSERLPVLTLPPPGPADPARAESERMPFIGNIGAPELIIILIIALVILGPGKLPDVAQSLGKSVREFRKAATDLSDAANLDPNKPSGALSAPIPPANTLADASQPNQLGTAPAPKPASTDDGDAAAS
jgi:orotidine 5'-phosphate decarboxylase subfamily 2